MKILLLVVCLTIAAVFGRDGSIGSTAGQHQGGATGQQEATGAHQGGATGQHGGGGPTSGVASTNPDNQVQGEVEFCIYNLNLVPGDGFYIRDYLRTKDTHIQPDFGVVSFTYTGAGANDPTVPADWHLTDFNLGTEVFVATADEAAGTGNHGTGRYRIYAIRAGQTKFDDHMTIRVTNDNSSRTDLQAAQCSIPPPDVDTVDAAFNGDTIPADLSQRVGETLGVNATQVECHNKGKCDDTASGCTQVEIEFKTDNSGHGRDSRELSSEFEFRLNDNDTEITSLGFRAASAVLQQPTTPAGSSAAATESNSGSLVTMSTLVLAAVVSLFFM